MSERNIYESTVSRTQKYRASIQFYLSCEINTIREIA